MAGFYGRTQTEMSKELLAPCVGADLDVGGPFDLVFNKEKRGAKGSSNRRRGTWFAAAAIHYGQSCKRKKIEKRKRKGWRVGSVAELKVRREWSFLAPCIGAYR